MLNVTLIVEFSSLWAIKLKKKILSFHWLVFCLSTYLVRTQNVLTAQAKKRAAIEKKTYSKKNLYDICGISKVTKKATRKFRDAGGGGAGRHVPP